MKYAITLPNFDVCSDPKVAFEIVQLTEEAGWDGFFLWDHALWTWPHPMPVVDPFTMLGAMAVKTERIMLGTMITPVPRRRPGTLARQIATLDHLSGGRAIAGFGIGGDWFGDYTGFGEEDNDKLHGEMLDEGLDVINGLWSGEPFSYEGAHFRIKDVQFLPKPVQQPRIPIWVAGRWPNKKPFARAARWDGAFPLLVNEDREMSAQDVKEILEYTLPLHESDTPFDLVVSSTSKPDKLDEEREQVASFAEAGATWWLAGFSVPGNYSNIRRRIELGPPR